MSWWLAGLVAAFGALAAEAAEIDLIRRRAGRLPWNRKGRSTHDGVTYAPLNVYLVGVLARASVGGVVGGVYAAGNQIAGMVGALTLGISASAMLARFGEAKDLGTQPHPSELPRQPAEKPPERRADAREEVADSA